jgi:hypothetical protein
LENALTVGEKTTLRRFVMTDKELYNPDEFLLDNIKSFHYEVMDEGHHVWAAFYMEDGTTGHLNIFLNAGRIQTRYEEWNED